MCRSKSILCGVKFCDEIVTERMELKIEMDLMCSSALGVKTHNYFDLTFRLNPGELFYVPILHRLGNLKRGKNGL